MLDYDKLQKTLRNLESVDIINLAKIMHMEVDDLLTCIRDEIMEKYKVLFRKNAFKIPFFTNEETKEFFNSQLVDLGFLCQHVIKDFSEPLKQKHSTLAHQSMYNIWLLNRGY